MIPAGEACRNDVIAGVIALAAGSLLLIWPAKLQQRQIRFQERHPKLTALNPFAEWNKSPAALLLIRCSALMPFFMALVSFYFAVESCLK